MADDAIYICGATNDYLNVFPFWDWRKVLGITSYVSDRPVKCPQPVVEKVVSLHITHGMHHWGETYQYILLSSVT